MVTVLFSICGSKMRQMLLLIMRRRERNELSRARSNNGMHPTPHQRGSHDSCAGARVMPGVRLLSVRDVPMVKELIPLYVSLIAAAVTVIGWVINNYFA